MTKGRYNETSKDPNLIVALIFTPSSFLELACLMHFNQKGIRLRSGGAGASAVHKPTMISVLRIKKGGELVDNFKKNCGRASKLHKARLLF